MTKRDCESDDWRTHARADRLNDSIMKRLYSVISIYAVVVALVILVMVSFKKHPSHCQLRVKESEYVIFAHSSVSEDVLKRGISNGLKSLNMSIPITDRKDRHLSSWTQSFYDTPNNILRGSALQVKERYWPDSPYIEYSIRYIRNDLCTDRPPFALTTEKSTNDYSKKILSSVSDGFQTRFIDQKLLYSKIRNRVATGGGMELAFPSLRQIITSPAAVSLKFNEYRVDPIFSEPIFFKTSNSTLVSDISLERWVSNEKKKGGFFLIRLHIGSLYEEIVMRKVYKSIKEELDVKKQLCPNFCGLPLIFL